MTFDRRPQVMAVLTSALEVPTAERQEVLRELCRDDSGLRREVESLLALKNEADRFLASPVAQMPAEGARKLEAGRRIGPYRINGVLGRGGMGTIYRAEREDDFTKQVAIKLIRHDFVDRLTVRRFHAERQILARLEHPSIARLLDGGATEDGSPYLVMEYVDGTPIDRYCDDRRLSATRRLELFRKVADAVAYAHQNLVVHRDLKPANVLVTPEGVPKLLDFGIAKLLEDGPVEALTVAGGAMTPRYASPEQVLGEPITTASDVYALGVLLYQLLTGRLPSGLDICDYQEIPRRILALDPQRLSTVVLRAPAPPPAPGPALGRPETVRAGGLETTDRGDEQAKVSNRESLSFLRDDDPRKLSRRLAGDVDAIVMKALRKEPRHRYASVEQLSADVLRHLEGLPVTARKGTWTYRAAKLLRRQKAGVAAVLAVAVLGVSSTVLWLRAERERERADERRSEAVRERERAEKISEFLRDLFKSANPDAARGGALTVREALDQGRARLAAGTLGSEPELEAAIAGTLGDVYRNLGLYDEALELLAESARLRRKLYPEGHPELVTVVNDLASVYYYLGDWAEAESRFREALDMRRRLGQKPAAIARALSNLASTLKQQGRYAEAAELYGEALAIREKSAGPEDPDLASSLYSLGALHYEQGDLERADPLLRRALEIRTRALGEKHTLVATVMNTLGRVRLAAGDLEEAEELQRRTLAIRRDLLGTGNVHVALAEKDLAEVLLRRGETAAAGELLTGSLAVLRASEAPAWAVADAEGTYGAYLAALGRFEEAEPYVLAGLAGVREAKGEGSIRTRLARERVAAFLAAWGRPARAPDAEAEQEASSLE